MEEVYMKRLLFYPVDHCFYYPEYGPPFDNVQLNQIKTVDLLAKKTPLHSLSYPSRVTESHRARYSTLYLSSSDLSRDQ